MIYPRGYRTAPGRADTLSKEATMCYPVTCPVCGKITWDGCGQHVAEVKASVPAEQWCGGQHGTSTT